MSDTRSGFTSGNHALDDYFARHALDNDGRGVGRAYVLRRAAADPPEFPPILGFYTLSMANVASEQVASLLDRLPKYPMPTALIGRLAVDKRAQRRGLGEILLMDALRRAVDASTLIGCIGVIVDAKDEGAEQFYEKYDFVTVHAASWPLACFSRSTRRAPRSTSSRCGAGT